MTVWCIFKTKWFIYFTCKKRHSEVKFLSCRTKKFKILYKVLLKLHRTERTDAAQKKREKNTDLRLIQPYLIYHVISLLDENDKHNVSYLWHHKDKLWPLEIYWKVWKCIAATYVLMYKTLQRINLNLYKLLKNKNLFPSENNNTAPFSSNFQQFFIYISPILVFHLLKY